MRGLLGALRSFETGPYAVTRNGASTYSAGRLDDPTGGDAFEVMAVVQPAEPDEVARLPEGLLDSEVLVVYTRVELRTGGENQIPDQIEIDDVTYSVEKVERWQGVYWRALVSKVG